MGKMPDDERRGYQRGYNARGQGVWPAHRPPTPPNEIVGPFVTAMRSMRDRVDYWIAGMEQDDPMVVDLGAQVDAVDAALARMDEWLRTGATP